MSSNTLAERLSCSKAEADKIIEDFYSGFPNIKKFNDDSKAFLKEHGYVTDLFGRRRRLPDALLPEYEFRPVTKITQFNPLLGTSGHKDISQTSEFQQKVKHYKALLQNVKKISEIDPIIKDAAKNNVEIRRNGALIAKAERQILNSRIQGSAASMTKAAMIMIQQDKELQDLGFKLLVTVHDEVFGECPTINSERCGERLCEVMVEAAETKCSYTPWKCDPYIVSDGWYEDEVIGAILKDYNSFKKKGLSEEEAIIKTQDTYQMYNKDSIELVCKDSYIIGRDSLKLKPEAFK